MKVKPLSSSDTPGSGKSVAIKHIVGLLDPDIGTVWVDGKEVPKPSATRALRFTIAGRLCLSVRRALRFDEHRRHVAMGLRKEGSYTEEEISSA
jgi:phospholipid/cholesterol/gamma-HCH transport system ATP-binding protein